MKASRVHLVLSAIWAVLSVPTILWWRDSILWLSLMTVYGIVGVHWSAYQGARSEEAQSAGGDKAESDSGSE